MKRFALACALSIIAVSAFGQRTFVSGNGLDTNPCSISSPCRTLQQALNAVPAGGEVVMLDTAGYGASLTINKSVNILSPDGIYGVLAGGITIAAGSSDIIRIRGLDILGTSNSSGTGVDIGTCKRTELEKMRISKVQVGVKISQDVKAIMRHLTITDVTFGIWSIGTNTAAQVNGTTSPPLKVTVEYTSVIGAQVGVKVDAGSFQMIEGNSISYSTTDTYLIDSKVASCSGLSLNSNSDSGSYYNNFTGLFNSLCSCMVEDLRRGDQNNGNCNAN